MEGVRQWGGRAMNQVGLGNTMGNRSEGVICGGEQGDIEEAAVSTEARGAGEAPGCFRLKEGYVS